MRQRAVAQSVIVGDGFDEVVELGGDFAEVEVGVIGDEGFAAVFGPGRWEFQLGYL